MNRKLALCAYFAATLMACKAKHTYVHVQIQPASSEPPGIKVVELQLTLGGRTANTLLKESSGADLSFPTDTTLEIGSGAGALAITAIARSADGRELDRGTQTVDVKSAAVTEATVVLAGGKAELFAQKGTQPFGSVAQGSASTPVQLVFGNIGFKPSGALQVTLTGSGAGEFSIGANTCTGVTLAPNATCQVTTTFQPVSIGQLTATLTVTGTPGGTVSTTLTGTGLAAPQTVTVTVAGSGAGTVTSTPAGINCPGTCSFDFPYNSQVLLTASPSTGTFFSGWAGECTNTTNGCTILIPGAFTYAATAYFGFCAGASSETFTSSLVGCPGKVTFANRASLCAPGCSVATADQWVNAVPNLAAKPLHHYWTDDALRYSFGSGTCGAGSVCNTGRCFASNGDTYTSSACAGQPMRVCAGTGGAVPDPEGNTCNWTGCGYNSIGPSAYFGGCAAATDSTAGALCTCGGPAVRYVDAVNGNDGNPGSAAAPLKTITAALAAVKDKLEIVYVRPGTYDGTNGETFPITVPTAVALIGDEAGRGTATTITGSGFASGNPQAAVYLGDNATIAGFTISNTAGNGVFLLGSGVTIRNNTIMNAPSSLPGAGIWASLGTSHNVLLNALQKNYIAIVYRNAGATSFTGKVENNTITTNTYGIYYEAWGGDAGGGAAGSVGNNVLSCNTSSDVWTRIATTTFLRNNRWDHNPPTLGCAPGNDTCASGTGITFDTASASLASPVCLP